MAVQQEAVARPGAFLETVSVQALSTLLRDHKRHSGSRGTRLLEEQPLARQLPRSGMG